MKIHFTEFPMDSNWVKGTVHDGLYSFEAKLFDENSTYGIDDGKVSKLSISYGSRWTGFDNCFVNYDRGWDIEPETEEEHDVFIAVLDFLEDAPTRFL